MQVYFSHPMVTYHTKLEQEAINALETKFSQSNIYNPAELPSQDMDFYLKRVSESDILVFTTTQKDIIGRGVYAEIQRAKELRKPIWFFNPHKQQFSLNYTIELLPSDNWVKYATAKEKFLSEGKIVIIDTETTGTRRNADSIVEIAAISLDYHTLEQEIIFDSLCNPGLSKETLEKTWICENDFIAPNEILAASSIAKVSKAFRSNLRDFSWTTYNLEFDAPFLFQKPWKLENNAVPCIMIAAKPACEIPHPEYGFKLPKLGEAHTLLVQPKKESHRALSDALMATNVLTKLIEKNHYVLNSE